MHRPSKAELTKIAVEARDAFREAGMAYAAQLADEGKTSFGQATCLVISAMMSALQYPIYGMIAMQREDDDLAEFYTERFMQQVRTALDDTFKDAGIHVDVRASDYQGDDNGETEAEAGL